MTNDLADWFPVLQASGAMVPRTEIIKTDCDLLDLLDGKQPKGFAKFEQDLIEAADRIGYPLFFRSGHTSAKHDWRKTCYVEESSYFRSHLFNIIEYGELSSMMGLPVQSWAIRELLPVEPLFTAFYGKTPITKERRYFIENGNIICHHPYWPTDSIQDPSVENWLELLESSNRESPDEINLLSGKSAQVSKSFKGAWSLDWLHTRNGWVAIDMALARDSFHWPGCENPSL